MIKFTLHNILAKLNHGQVIDKFLNAAMTNDETTLKKYVKSPVMAKHICTALSIACTQKYQPGVQVLLAHASHADIYTTCIVTSGVGPAEALPWLLEHAPHLGTHCLREAVKAGNIETLTTLIELTNPKADNSAALQCAVECGYADCGYTECIDLLYPVSDPHAALQGLKQKQYAQNIWISLERRIQHNTLTAALTDCPPPKKTSTRKM